MCKRFLLKMEDIRLVGKYLPLFPEFANLPTYSEVFRKFMFHLRAEKQKPRASAQLTTQALKTSWNKKRLNHLIDDVTVEKKILRYYETWKSLQKHILRMSVKETEKRNEFSHSLRNLFDIAKKYKSKTKEEKKASQYLQEQREQSTLPTTTETDPTETISYSDFEEEANLQATEETNPPTSEQKEASLQQKKTLTGSDFESSSQTQSESFTSIGTIGDDLQIPGPSKSSSTPKPQLKNVITVDVAAALDRCKVSDRNAVFLISSIAKSLGHDVSSLLLNKESIRYSRKKKS